MSDYNGYTNRETWLVNLHYGEFFQEVVSDGQDLTADYMEDMFDDILARTEMNAMFRDMIDLGSVNWRELEELYVSQAAQGINQ